MSAGGSRVVNLSAPMSDVVIGNPDVADAYVRSQNQLYIIAKKPGESTIFVTAKNGKVLFSGTVRVGNNLTSIDDMLRLAMPDASIAVNKMNGMVLLTGTIKAPEDAAEAERLTQAFVGKDVTVVSRLRMATPLPGDVAGQDRRSQQGCGPQDRHEPGRVWRWHWILYGLSRALKS